MCAFSLTLSSLWLSLANYILHKRWLVVNNLFFCHQINLDNNTFRRQGQSPQDNFVSPFPHSSELANFARRRCSRKMTSLSVKYLTTHISPCGYAAIVKQRTKADSSILVDLPIQRRALPRGTFLCYREFWRYFL